jgi:hypothetical protein
VLCHAGGATEINHEAAAMNSFWARLFAAIFAIMACMTAQASTPWSLAVLGDSDSHGYADTEWFAPGSDLRGGTHRAHTLQWTEALAALRPQHLDLGERGSWGLARWQVKFYRTLGLPFRFPRKLDHRYNFAWNGAGCDALLAGGDMRQAERLLAEMNREPQRWSRGVVVIRIGINDLGAREVLDRMARGAADAQLLQTGKRCADAVAGAVEMIRKAHPQVRFALVGILDNVDWPPNWSAFRSAEQRAHISAYLDRYDAALRELAARDPQRMLFVDDRQWFAGRWGQRSSNGEPAYRSVALPGVPPILHAQGDAPTRTVLGDGHFGLAANALWAQALVAHLNRAFDAQIPPIRDEEVAGLIQRALSHKP